MNRKAIKAGLVSAITIGLVFLGIQLFSSDHSSGNDRVDFAQMMIPHHQQAVEMSEFALANTSNPSILALAGKIIGEQEVEIELMQNWLDTAGVELVSSSHAGHDSGMLSDAQMDSLASARDYEFDLLFVNGMIEHHEGAIIMAENFANSSDSDLAALTIAIIEVQNQEIAELRTILN